MVGLNSKRNRYRTNLFNRGISFISDAFAIPCFVTCLICSGWIRANILFTCPSSLCPITIQISGACPLLLIRHDKTHLWEFKNDRSNGRKWRWYVYLLFLLSSLSEKQNKKERKNTPRAGRIGSHLFHSRTVVITSINTQYSVFFFGFNFKKYSFLHYVINFVMFFLYHSFVDDICPFVFFLGVSNNSLPIILCRLIFMH